MDSTSNPSLLKKQIFEIAKYKKENTKNGKIRNHQVSPQGEQNSLQINFNPY